MLRISCPNCQKKYKLKDESCINKKVRCTQCNTSFIVPETAADQTAAETAAQTLVSEIAEVNDNAATLISQHSEPSAVMPQRQTVPRTLPGYELIKIIGKGGMGAVVEAVQLSLNRSVAVKFLFPNLEKNEKIVRRFNQEIDILVQLGDHPNIVSILDRGKTASPLYYIMELVNGRSLRTYIQEGMKPADILHYGLQIAAGLQHAHFRHIIHRDVKPDNILIDQYGHAKVTDFGIAGMQQQSSQSPLTMEQTRLGTLAYMAPEQKESALAADERSDIYSFGVMLYQMLMGRLPEGIFLMPSEADISLADWNEIIAKCLHQDPHRRYQNFGEVIEALKGMGTADATVRQTQRKPADYYVDKNGNVILSPAVQNSGQAEQEANEQAERDAQAAAAKTAQLERDLQEAKARAERAEKERAERERAAAKRECPYKRKQLQDLLDSKRYHEAYQMLKPYQDDLPDGYDAQFWSPVKIRIGQCQIQEQNIGEVILQGNFGQAERQIERLKQFAPDYPGIETLRQKLQQRQYAKNEIETLLESRQCLDAYAKLRTYLAAHPQYKDYGLLTFIPKIEAQIDWMRKEQHDSVWWTTWTALLGGGFLYGVPLGVRTFGGADNIDPFFFNLIGYVFVGICCIFVLLFIWSFMGTFPARCRHMFTRFKLRLRKSEFSKAKLSETVWFAMLKKEWQQEQSSKSRKGER